MAIIRKNILAIFTLTFFVAMVSAKEIIMPIVTPFCGGKAAAVSFVMCIRELPLQKCRQEYLELMKKHGIRSSIYISSSTLKPMLMRKDISALKQLIRFAEDGHTIGISFSSEYWPGQKNVPSIDIFRYDIDAIPKTLFNLSDGKIVVRDVILKGISSYEFRKIAEARGMLINDLYDYRTRYEMRTDRLNTCHAPEPDELAEEAILNHSFLSFSAPGEWWKPPVSSAEADMIAFYRECFRQTAEADIYCAPYWENEQYQEAYRSSSMKILSSDKEMIRFVVEAPKRFNSTLLSVQIDIPGSTVVQNKIRLTPGKRQSVYDILPNQEVRILYEGAAFPLPSVNISAFPEGKRGGVCFTFDDTNPDHVNLWGKLLSELKIKGTFNLNIGDKRWRKIARKLHDSGHEIGCHSYSHSMWFCNMSEQKIRNDIEAAAREMMKDGYPLLTFCFPGNYHTRTARKIVREYFPFMIKNERHMHLFQMYKNPDYNDWLDHVVHHSEMDVHMLHEAGCKVVKSKNGTQEIHPLYDEYKKMFTLFVQPQYRERIWSGSWSEWSSYERMKKTASIHIEDCTSNSCVVAFSADTKRIPVHLHKLHVVLDAPPCGILEIRERGEKIPVQQNKTGSLVFHAVPGKKYHVLYNTLLNRLRNMFLGKEKQKQL